MVAYVPPDRVILTVGASFRTEPMLAAGARLMPLIRQDAALLAEVGVGTDTATVLDAEISELKNLWGDPRAKKHDTALQMNELAELMARARAWMATLRAIASINLGLDAPSLNRISSVGPELADGYARDVLADLEGRIEAARDMKPRIEECGLSDAFLGRGRTLARQLKTAIGAEDVDAANLHFTVRRLYVKKGGIYMMLKRAVRAGRLVHLVQAARREQYHLEELEPKLVEHWKVEKAPAAAPAKKP
ncbi:hypothetical protein L6R52_08000 [Myxococcota bacterium]|nr:hypothetical protein [Myxococcota bacterium]